MQALKQKLTELKNKFSPAVQEQTKSDHQFIITSLKEIIPANNDYCDYIASVQYINHRLVILTTNKATANELFFKIDNLREKLKTKLIVKQITIR